MSGDSVALICAGLTIIILGFILQQLCQYDSMYLYGWGCCDVYVGIVNRNKFFVNKQILEE